MNDLLRDKALEALELAARQNGHDMLLTGEELRKVEDAITSLRAAAPVVQQGVSDEQIDEIAASMTWHDGDADRLDHRQFARSILSLAGAAAGGVPQDLISAADAHADMYEGSDIPARDVRAAITNAFYAGSLYAAPAGVPLSASPAAPAPQTDPSSGQCPYAALEGQVCNKCGRIHSAQAAVEGQQAVAWMDPDTRDVINAERKHDWNNHFGMGGVAKAKGYTMPLYASPAVAPSAQPVRMLTDAMVDAAQVLAPCCTRREDVRAMLQAAIGAAPSAQEPQAAEQKESQHG